MNSQIRTIVSNLCTFALGVLIMVGYQKIFGDNWVKFVVILPVVVFWKILKDFFYVLIFPPKISFKKLEQVDDNFEGEFLYGYEDAHVFYNEAYFFSEDNNPLDEKELIVSLNKILRNSFHPLYKYLKNNSIDELNGSRSFKFNMLQPHLNFFNFNLNIGGRKVSMKSRYTGILNTEA